MTTNPDFEPLARWEEELVTGEDTPIFYAVKEGLL